MCASPYMHICSGSARFVNSTYQVFENDGSIQVCVRVEGYGFAVNVSAGMDKRGEGGFMCCVVLVST